MLNLFSAEVRRNPFPVYEQIRRTTPVLHFATSDIWMVFDYDGVKRVLSDHEAFGSDLAVATGHPTPPWLVFFDPPRHTKLRALITRAFTPRVIANLEPRIRALSRELWSRTSDRTEIDLAADYAIPLPMMVIAEMIGIPSADWVQFRSWSDAILKLSYTIRGLKRDQDEALAAAQHYALATAEMRAYLPHLIQQRRAAPREDLLTRLIEAEVDGEGLTQEEMLGFFQLLLVGGQETTSNLINNAILCFLENPDQLDRVRAKADLLPAAIEEVLRYRSPLQLVFRGTKCDVELGGQTIPAGKMVFAVIGAANRDPQHFDKPACFDVTRDPNPHLAFGHGLHFCLGTPLSRLESRIALTDLLQWMKRFELATAEPWEPRQALHVHGPARLPLRFER